MRALFAPVLAALALALAGPVPALASAPAALHGDFVQARRLKGLDHALLSQGVFVLLPGRGLVWRALEPLATSVVVTPGGVFDLDPSGRFRRVAAGSRPLELMDRVLGGDTTALRRVFRVRREGGAASWRLLLEPKAGALSRLLRSAEIRGSGAFVVSARLREASGDETDIRFERVAVGPGPLTPSEEALLGP